MRHQFRVLSAAALGVMALCCSRPAADGEQTVLAAAAAQPGATPPAIEVNSFYDDLEPYGDWVEMPDYGWSFAPRVDDDWRPYTRGQWEYTDDGWYWDSDEDFGWATYHYGRWVDDRRYGWVWIPGEEWAPAWVSWRQGNGYTGWAPLPPRAGWRANVGLQIGGLELDAYIGARDYNFVEDRHFVDRGVYQRLQPSTINITIINQTSNVTNYTTVNNRVFNRGVAIGDVERSVGRKVSQLRTVDRARRDDRSRGRSGEVAVFRPQVRMSNDRKPARGRSVVKGETPPQALVERGKRREQARPGPGREADVTARDAAQRPREAPGRGARQPDVQAPRATPRQQPPARDQSSREADAQRARIQEQQRLDEEKRQTERRARDEQQAEQNRREQQRGESARQKRTLPPQTGDRGRGTRGPDVGRPAPPPAATRPPEAPRPDPRAQEQAAQRERDQAARDAARQQQAQAQEQQRIEREKARADRQPREQPRGRQPEANRGRDKRQDAPPPQAEKQKQDPQEKKAPPGQGRDKGKKEPKPTPAPRRSS